MMRFSCFFMALILLAGCESAADRTQRKSPDYRAGYNDGCGSAGNGGANPRASGLIRDDAAFAGNKAYHAGWSTGFNACRSSGLGTGGSEPGSRGPIADPNPRPF
jgi:hypothetical protein